MIDPLPQSDDPSNNPGNFFIRLLLITVYVLILGIVRLLLWFVLLVQLASHLLTGRANVQAQQVGLAVTQYVYDVWCFLTYNTNQRPFPFRSKQ